MATNYETLLNTIRSNASAEYQARVPEATRTNLQDVGGALLADVNLANEFTSALMNKVAFTVVHSKIFQNPLALLKKGAKPYGDSVEEIFVNYAKAEVYDPTGATLLERKLPDVKAIYHTMNRQDKYKVTVGLEQLQKAFRSYGDLGRFITTIINSLYNGDNLDEFILFKKLLTGAITGGLMKVIEVADPNASAENAKAFIKAVKTVSTNMTFASSEYNGYLTAQSTDTKPITTFSGIDEQYIIMEASTYVSVGLDVLASIFHLEPAQFEQRVILVDTFPEANVRCVLIDKDFTQIYDDLYQLRQFENGEGLYTNYVLHHWQTISASCLVNAVAFKVGA